MSNKDFSHSDQVLELLNQGPNFKGEVASVIDLNPIGKTKLTKRTNFSMKK